MKRKIILVPPISFQDTICSDHNILNIQNYRYNPDVVYGNNNLYYINYGQIEAE